MTNWCADKRVTHVEPLPATALLSYVPALRRYAFMLCGNRETADDLVQECLLRAIEHLDRFEPGTNARAWLMAILRNFYFNAHVRKKRERLWASTEEERAFERSVPASQTDSVALHDLGRALALLPLEQREALLLVAVQELSYEETAAVIGVPIGTIRSRLNRARTKLLSLSGEG